MTGRAVVLVAPLKEFTTTIFMPACGAKHCFKGHTSRVAIQDLDNRKKIDHSLDQNQITFFYIHKCNIYTYLQLYQFYLGV